MRKKTKLQEMVTDKVAISLLKTEIQNIKRENAKLRKSVTVTSPSRK